MWEFISIVILVGVIYYTTTRARNGDSQKKSAPDSTPPNQKGWRDKVRERLNIDEKKDNSGIKMIAYFVLLVIAFSVFHFTDGSNSFWYTFWVVIIGLHTIWFLSFFLIPGEGVGGITKFVIFGTFVFFFLAGIFPHKSDEWLGNIKAWRTEVDNKKSGETVHEIAPGVPAFVVAVKEHPTEWISLPAGRDTSAACDGDGTMYIRYQGSKEGGDGPFDCSTTSKGLNINTLNHGRPPLNVAYRFQSKDKPFPVYFYDCTLPGSCRMK